jgi:nicotinamidase/pyrazinamidase
MAERWGVIVVDLQGDFTEWKQGSLAVPDTGEDYVREVERATRLLKEKGIPIFGSQDWHPPDPLSFFTSHPGMKAFDTIIVRGTEQALWPPHCVQGTENARFLIDEGLFSVIVKKAKDPAFDGYSAFRDDANRATGLDEILKKNGVSHLLVYGLAIDYCVQATAVDAVAAGYRVYLVEALCRGIGPETTVQALDRMKREGVEVIGTAEEALRVVTTRTR